MCIVWEDPVQIANGYLANELFVTLGAYTISARHQPALSGAAGRLAAAGWRWRWAIYRTSSRTSLRWADVQAVAPSIVAAVAKRSPADRMFSDGIRYAGVATLAKYQVEEGFPLCLMVTEQAWDIDDFTHLLGLQRLLEGLGQERAADALHRGRTTFRHVRRPR